MNTVAMPADLLGAMAAGSGITLSDAVSDTGGAFGKMLGALMESGQTVPDDVAASGDMSMETPEETEKNADIKAIAAAILSGKEADVPAAKLVSEETAEAFAKTLLKFTEGDITPEDIKEIWQDVPAEEKAAFAELVKAVFTDNTSEKPAEAPELPQMYADGDITAQPEMPAKQEAGAAVKLPEMTGNENAVPEVEIAEIIQVVYKSAETEETAPDKTLSVKYIIRSLLTAIRKNLSKSKTDDEESDKSAVYDAIAAFAPAVNRNILTAVTANASEETAAQAVTSAEESVRLPEVETEKIIQNVYDSLETTDETELETFCKELAKVLEEQQPEAQTDESANITAARTDNAESRTVNAFSSGRQAFMSRVKNAFDAKTPQISAMTGINGMKDISFAKAAIPENTEKLAEDLDISDQILQRIDLIEDIANMTAGSEKEITLNLAPKELGGLEIKIKNTSDGISIAFAAERSEAARLIGEKTNVLAEAVASRGMQVKEMSVTQQIVTEKSHDNVMSYSGMNSGNRSYGGSQSESEPENYGRTFTFDADGNVTASEPENGKEIYYNREAKLWLSA